MKIYHFVFPHLPTFLSCLYVDHEDDMKHGDAEGTGVRRLWVFGLMMTKLLMTNRNVTQEGEGGDNDDKQAWVTRGEMLACLRRYILTGRRTAHENKN